MTDTGLQTLNHLLSSPLQKRFVDSWSMELTASTSAKIMASLSLLLSKFNENVSLASPHHHVGKVILRNVTLEFSSGLQRSSSPVLTTST